MPGASSVRGVYRERSFKNEEKRNWDPPEGLRAAMRPELTILITDTAAVTVCPVLSARPGSRGYREELWCLRQDEVAIVLRERDDSQAAPAGTWIGT